MSVAAPTVAPTTTVRHRPSLRVSGPVVPTAVGFALMAVAWEGASLTTDVDRQITWLTLAVMGSALSCGASVWFVTRQYVALRLRLAALSAGQSEALSGPANGTADGTLVASPAMVRFHRPSCPVTTGKAVTAASRAKHVSEGREPCGMCQP